MDQFYAHDSSVRQYLDSMNISVDTNQTQEVFVNDQKVYISRSMFFDILILFAYDHKHLKKK